MPIFFFRIIRAYCEEHEANSAESETDPPNTYVPASEKPILDTQELYYQLHDKRRMVADREKLPLHHIFSNKTLEEMVTQLPQSVEAFRKIHRISRVKTEKYADDFLPIIRDYCKEHGVGSVEKTTKAPNTSKLTSKDPNEYDPELFELLQDKCRILAKAEHRAVFTNRTLKEMATHLPRTRTAFRRIHGIGTVKTEKYVDIFLPIIQTYCEEHRIDSTETKTGGLNTNDTTSKKPDEYAHDLFEQLQDKCKTLEKAEQEGIFTDGTLREIATAFPRTREAFAQIRGISLRKMEKYADEFLPIIRAYCEEHGIE